MTELIRAASPWPTNAHLIRDCAKLGYLHIDWRVLDPTYNVGNWWTLFRPEHLQFHTRTIEPDFDFRELPYSDDTFDAVAFDPPYVAMGGRASSTLRDFQESYGLYDAPSTPSDLQELINEGMTECVRVLKPALNKRQTPTSVRVSPGQSAEIPTYSRPVPPGGYLLVKCQDYVSSGKLWIGTHYTLTHGLSLGLELVDRLEMIGNGRAQPLGRRQVHARRNLSTLFVFRKKR